jgi:cardiolipin synthase
MGMTLANKITVLRILLVPVFVVQLLYYADTGDHRFRLIALLAFTVATLTDALDGYVARRYQQHSELGALLDPIADKLLLTTAIIILTFNHEPYLDRMPLWVTVTIFTKDVLLLAGFSVLHVVSGKISVRTRYLGKVATVLQMVAIFWILLQWHDEWLFTWTTAAGLFTGVSGLQYIFDWFKQLNASPSSTPRADQ